MKTGEDLLKTSGQAKSTREGGKRINNRTVIQLLGSLRATRCWQYIWRDGPLNMIVMFTRMSGEVDNQGLGRQKRKEIKYSCG